MARRVGGVEATSPEPQDAPPAAENKSRKTLTDDAESSILNNMDTDFKRIEGEHSIQQDVAAVNPGYGQPGRTHNCANSVAAYEMRRRGYDVEANPRGDKGIAYNEWRSMFEGFQPLRPTSRTKTRVVEEIEREVGSWGEGARGMVVGGYGDNKGHTFSVEVSDGRVLFVDGQRSEVDAKYNFREMAPSSIRYGRLDNLKPTAWVRGAIRNRRTLL